MSDVDGPPGRDRAPASTPAVSGLPALAAVTALIYLLDAVALTCGTVLRTPGTNSPRALGALALFALALATYALARGRRLRTGEATAMLALQMVGVASMSRSTHLDLAALSNGFGLSMLGAYASWLLARPAAAVYYAGLALWVSAIALRENLYLTVAGLLLVGQAVVTAEIVWTLRTRVARLTDLDPLTGVLNRRGMDAAVSELLRRRARSATPVSVALIDLDDLRQVNNTAGHRAGDALLVTASEEWRVALGRSRVLVGRIGGDEFVLLFDGADEAAARSAVVTLRVGSDVRWTAGIAELGPGESFSEALARADAEMYANKERKPPQVPRPRRAEDDRLPGVSAW